MFAILTLMTAFALPAGPAPPVAPSDTPRTPPPAAASGDASSDAASDAASDPARALLAELETAAEGLRTVSAKVRHEIVDTLLEEKVVRFGRLLYRIDSADGSRAIAFAFEREVRSGRSFNDRVRYVIKGRWLVEVDPDEKIFIKRAVAGPDEAFDPLALGDGFFPLPIGQSAAAVLERFDAALVDLPEDGALAKLRGGEPIDGIRLVPHADTKEAKEMQRIDVFYDRATRLPVGVHVIEADGDEQIAVLTELERNGDVDAERLAWLDIEPPDPTEWSVDIR